MNNRYFTIILMNLLTIMPLAHAMKGDPSPLNQHFHNFFNGKVQSKDARTPQLDTEYLGRDERINELKKHFKNFKEKKVISVRQRGVIEYCTKALLKAVQGEANSNTITRVKELLQNGANINAEDKNGWTPLLHAGLTAYNQKLIKYLLEEGADPQEAFYPFALTGSHRLITPFILYVPTSYLNSLKNKSMEIDTEAHEYATKKIVLLKKLCSVKFNDDTTLVQKIAEIKIPRQKNITTAQLIVINMLDPENLEQHRQDIVIEFKRRLFGN